MPPLTISSTILRWKFGRSASNDDDSLPQIVAGVEKQGNHVFRRKTRSVLTMEHLREIRQAWRESKRTASSTNYGVPPIRAVSLAFGMSSSRRATRTGVSIEADTSMGDLKLIEGWVARSWLSAMLEGRSPSSILGALDRRRAPGPRPLAVAKPISAAADRVRGHDLVLVSPASIRERARREDRRELRSCIPTSTLPRVRQQGATSRTRPLQRAM